MNQNPRPILETETDVLWIVEDGEEVSLLEPFMQKTASDWSDFDPTRCETFDIKAFLAELQSVPSTGTLR